MSKPLSPKVLTLPQAILWSRGLQRRGLVVVATNGCFDLLHFGHIDYLQRARACGDRLIIGLNSDASVRRLKGPSRPLVPARFRAAVLAALECVDAVVIFPQTRADRFLAAIRPNIYVKGGDYRPETLDPAERRSLAAAGSRIKILKFVPGLSTTKLVARIRGQS